MLKYTPSTKWSSFHDNINTKTIDDINIWIGRPNNFIPLSKYELNVFFTLSLYQAEHTYMIWALIKEWKMEISTNAEDNT